MSSSMLSLLAGLGNGYQRGTAEQYRQDLSNDASALGFDPTGLAAMKAPVLVRVMDAKDVTADIGDRSNISNTARLSSVEQASTDARRLNLESLEFHEDGNPTQAAVTQFVRAMPTSEQTELIAPDGTPTKQAVDRLMAAAFKQAYGSDELVGLYAQAQDSEARTILSGLADAAGLMSALKDSGEFDIRGAVTEAAGFAVNARRLGHKLADMLKTPDMLMSDEARVVAQFMADNVRSAKKISEGLRNVAEYAAEQAQIARDNQSQDGMFGATPVASRYDVFKRLNGNKQITPQTPAPENHLQQPRGTAEVERTAQQAQAARPEAEPVAAIAAVEPAPVPASIPVTAPAATPTVASAEPAVEAPALTSYTNADAREREQHLADAPRLDRQEQVQREASGQTLTSETPVETRQDSTGEMFAEEKTQAQAKAAQEELAKKNAGKPKAVDPNQGGMFDDLPPEPAPAPDAITAAPASPPPVFKPVGESANTGNAGAELSYNKRNRIKNGIAWPDIADKDVALRVKETTKLNVHPKPDYQALVDAGMQPLIAHIVKQAYDALAVAPKTRIAPTDAQLQSYIAGVQRYMAGVMAWAGDPKLTRAWIGRMAQRSGKMAGAAAGSPIALSDLAGLPEKSLLTTVYPEGWRAHEPEIRLIGSNKALAALQPGVDEAISAMKDIDKGWPQKQEAWQRQGYTVVNDKERQFILLDKRNRSVGVHETLESAQEQARELTRRDAKSSTISDKGISVESAQRQGVEHRDAGEDISSDKLKDSFGFKGVNFGTWMLGESPAKVAERQLHLNHAFDSFMDLATVLGVPPKALSLDGLLGLDVAPCLLARDDESFTYNNRVNRLSTIQEHVMIRRAIERGVGVERLARAFNVNLNSINRRANLLDGIAPQAIALLQDQQFTPDVTRILRNMKPARQVEAVELMVASGTISVAHADALLKATPPEQRCDKRASTRAKEPPMEQIAKLEKEMSQVHTLYRDAENHYGSDLLNLVLAKGYLAKLLGNEAVKTFIDRQEPEILEHFELVVNTVSMEEAVQQEEAAA